MVSAPLPAAHRDGDTESDSKARLRLWIGCCAPAG